MKVSIVIPVFNEEKNIGKVIKKIESSIKTSHQILIVYDFKNDPTCKVVEKYVKASKHKNILLIKNSVGSGRGVMNAIKTGLKKAKSETIVVTMADLCDDVSQIDEMYQLIEGGYDIVCASRYMPGGKKIGGPLLKTFLSRLAGLTLHYIYKLPTHDATNAFKMYKKKIFDEIQIESTGGFEYSLEIVLKAFKKGCKITEIPTVWKDREAGKSNFKLLKWLPNYIKSYFYIFKKV